MGKKKLKNILPKKIRNCKVTVSFEDPYPTGYEYGGGMDKHIEKYRLTYQKKKNANL